MKGEQQRGHTRTQHPDKPLQHKAKPKRTRKITRGTTAQNMRLVLDFLTAYIAEHQYAPTIREIQDATGFKSPSSVHRYIELLENEGIIRRSKLSPRALEIVDKTRIMAIPEELQ